MRLCTAVSTPCHPEHTNLSSRAHAKDLKSRKGFSIAQRLAYARRFFVTAFLRMTEIYTPNSPLHFFTIWFKIVYYKYITNYTRYIR